MVLEIKMDLGDKTFHEDLHLKLTGIEDIITTDSYWFLQSLNKNDKENLHNNFIAFLESIIQRINAQKLGEFLFIPFSLYDECSGFIGIRKVTNKGLCNLFYVDSYIDGSDIDPWNDIKLSWTDVIGIKGGVYCQHSDITESLQKSIQNIIDFRTSL